MKHIDRSERQTLHFVHCFIENLLTSKRHPGLSDLIHYSANWPVSAILTEKYNVPYNWVEIIDEVALEALVRIPKPCVPKLRACLAM